MESGVSDKEDIQNVQGNHRSKQTIAKCEFYKLLIELSFTKRILLSTKAHINAKDLFIHYYKCIIISSYVNSRSLSER